MSVRAGPRRFASFITKRSRACSLGRVGAVAIAALPFFVTITLLIAGYLFHAPGTAHADDYQAYGYSALNYSDIIWLYLRDQATTHLRPFLDYRLEYPPLTGGLIYALGFARDLRLYFALTYGVLSICALATVAALNGLPGTKRWYFAATPALIFYTGLNWDLAAIAMLALALLAYDRRRDGWGTAALVLAIWLKLFPIVFLLSIVIERLRERRYRAAATISGIFIVGSLALNLPLARANLAGWGYFFTFNTSRQAEPSLWTLLPPLGVARIDSISLGMLVVGSLVLTAFAYRAKCPVALPLGGAVLLWWLCINKVYSPQYGLWVYLVLALLSFPSGLWRAFILLDLAYYYASFQILYTSTFAAPYSTGPLTSWQATYLLQPLVAVRLALLLAMLCWIVGNTLARSDERAIATSANAPAMTGAKKLRLSFSSTVTRAWSLITS